MMKYQIVVPSLWYNEENENPLIKLSQYGFVVPTECKPWKQSGNENLIACVNSFGFGGTNAHCIVEQYLQNKSQKRNNDTCLPFIITISAHSEDSLISNVRHIHDLLKLKVYDIGSVSYTSTCKRDHRPNRKALYGTSQDGIIAAAATFLSVGENIYPPLESKQVVFVFCGVGTSWTGMCSSLMKLKVFKEAVLCIDKHLKAHSGWMISNKLTDGEDILSNPMVSHIAIFACQIGLAAMWKELGIVPDAVVGQSVGEVAAAYVAGYLDLQTATKIIFYRSKLLAAVTSGRMAVVHNVEIEIVKKHCEIEGSVYIAVFNSPTSCTVSGKAEDINTLRQTISTIENIRPKFIDLEVQCAYHSPHVEQAANDLEKQLQNIQSFQCHTPMFSTVTGEQVTNDLIGTPNYWGQNVRMPVLFSNAINAVKSKTGHNIFLEIGPGPVLRAHIEKILNGSNSYTLIPSMQKQSEVKTFTEALCTLYELGLNPKWKTIFPHQSDLTDIPIYQFRKHRKLYQSPNAVKKTQGKHMTNAEHMFVKQLPQKDDVSRFKIEISEETTPFVFQHIVAGHIILPGAAYADVGFEIGGNVLGLSTHNISLSLEFLRPLKIEIGTKSSLQISTVVQRNELLFHAKHKHVTMCKGWIKSTEESLESETLDIECLKLSVTNMGCKHMSADEIYSNLEAMGFKYGPFFTSIKSCITNGIESLTEIEIPNEVVSQYGLTTLHPCVLDGMMQSTINNSSEEILIKIKNEKLKFMPVAIGDLRMFGKPEKYMYIFTRRINTTILDCVMQVHYNILLLSKAGKVLVDLRNYTTYGKRNSSIAPCELSYRLTWHPVEKNSEPNKQTTNVLLLTNTPSQDLHQGLEEFENIFIFQNKNNWSNEEFVSNAFIDGTIGEIHAVILFISKHDDTDLNADSASYIHECVTNNCMLLTALVKYMTNLNISLPLYVVTQNTQPTLSNETKSINLIGEELWGFTRSIHLEFIHGDITLIDLQPTLQETKYTLVSFIRDTCHKMEKTKPEIIIHYETIYGAQFSKVQRREMIPALRVENRVLRKSFSRHEVLADRSKRVKSLIVTPSEENEVNNSKEEHISLEIKNVCLHPLSIYPRTTTGICLDQDIWRDNLDNGHNLFGLEYTGIPISGSTNRRFACGISEIHAIDQEESFNKWEILAIFPSSIATRMSVPRSCTIHMKDIPFYQPGLILTTVLCWNLSKQVPKRSSVFVYSCHKSSLTKLILETLVRSKKNANLVDLSNNNIHNETTFDVLLSLEKLDSSLPILAKCKKIICLQENISEPIRLKASRSGEQSVSTFSAIELLEKKSVCNLLPKVVSWLRKNSQSLGILEGSLQQDDSCRLPFNSFEIMKNGKVNLPIRNPINRLFSKSGIYIVTGGLTGLGWELIVLLAEMGAGIIGSISRRDRSADKADDIAKVEKTTGCKIINVKGDVTDLKSMYGTVKEIESYAKQESVRGIFHGAGVLNSQLLMNLEESQIDYVLQPKVIGTLNLHIVAKDMELDYFVVSSSINSLIGSPGQSSYGAANSFLDTFIEWRREQGLPGQAINWGALCVGMASRPQFVQNFTKRGFNLLTVLEIRSCFQDALMRNATSIVYADINWDICAKDYTNTKLERTRLQMSILIEQAVSHSMHFDNDGIDDMSFDVKTLQSAGTERQLAALTQVIQKISRKVIGGDHRQISMTSSIEQMAFDSMSTVTFINIVHDIIGFRIPPAFMLNVSNTLNDVKQLLYGKIFAVRL
ncbi:phthioceranic/hydroxyphthioceranic acid synthase-like [Ruditapes philippinarum]|uniref:phthioceranic/hydroxyphthioceranic acid synthase-like n=1 Tax=Ruditapes philippinarum TaxID=129788 RepID=UPI00295B1C3C|nr:phthioceranic/hydroxyphthioceranic acid synthase-like [Ruditapes philippinarum]